MLFAVGSLINIKHNRYGSRSGYSVLLSLTRGNRMSQINEAPASRGVETGAAVFDATHESPKVPASLTIQHGGTHYKGMAIEPAEYCHQNKLQFCESSAIKYLSRFRHKKGAEDLKKAMHFVAMCLEFDYGVIAKTTYSDDTDTATR